jgi:hypothetical protein
LHFLSPSVNVQGDAAGALAHLSVNAENKKGHDCMSGWIPTLIELLSSTSVGVQEGAAGVLANLCANDENKVTIASAGGIHSAARASRVGVGDRAGT